MGCGRRVEPGAGAIGSIYWDGRLKSQSNQPTHTRGREGKRTAPASSFALPVPTFLCIPSRPRSKPTPKPHDAHSNRILLHLSPNIIKRTGTPHRSLVCVCVSVAGRKGESSSADRPEWGAVAAAWRPQGCSWPPPPPAWAPSCPRPPFQVRVWGCGVWAGLLAFGARLSSQAVRRPFGYAAAGLCSSIQPARVAAARVADRPRPIRSKTLYLTVLDAAAAGRSRGRAAGAVRMSEVRARLGLGLIRSSCR